MSSILMPDTIKEVPLHILMHFIMFGSIGLFGEYIMGSEGALILTLTTATAMSIISIMNYLLLRFSGGDKK